MSTENGSPARREPSTAPVFVIGSPRSGTSILTWCLGQHPNILPLEETNWFSKLALALQSCHELGSARGERSQLSAMRISRDQLFRSVGEAINSLISGQRSEYEAANARIAQALGKPTNPQLVLARHPGDPKRRWVDGTPEYSLSVFALRKLFPDARFIHILRDPHEVVRSMVNFTGSAGYRLVKSEQEAYQYWLRTVRGCFDAERAFGSSVILRVRYRDLVESPERMLRACLDFLGEIYTADCLIPLQTKINSSGEQAAPCNTAQSTARALRLEAQELFGTLDAEQAGYAGSAEPAAELESHFVERARYIAWAEGELTRRLALEKATQPQEPTREEGAN